MTNNLDFYNKYIKYKTKYYQLKKYNEFKMKGGNKGTLCELNEENQKHEVSPDFVQNYSKYEISICSYCDEYIYRLKKSQNDWSDKTDEIEIDRQSYHSPSLNPMIKEILTGILTAKLNKINQTKKIICPILKNKNKELMEKQKKSRGSIQTNDWIEINHIRDKYKKYKCREDFGELNEVDDEKLL